MLRNYLIVAWKVLMRRKFFTFASLFGVGVTLMVLLIAVAMLDHVFAAQEPEIHWDRTLGIYTISLTGERRATNGPPGYGFLSRYIAPLAELDSVEAVSLVSMPETIVSYDRGRKIPSFLRHTDAEFWRLMSFQFLEGGPFSDLDLAHGNFVAVINRSTRERYFAGASAAGQTMDVDGRSFRVIGVVEDVPILRISSAADIWVPTTTFRNTHYQQDFTGGFLGLILARDRADFPAIKAEVEARARQAEKNLPDPEYYQTLSAPADTLFESVARGLGGDPGGAHAGRLRVILLGLGLLFLILPTVNLININLSRILERASEIGVRKAFGASSWTLVGQFVVENLVLTLLGGLLGLLLAKIALAAVNSSGVIPYSHFTINGRVFLYGLTMALVFGVLSGVYPAWRMSRLHPVNALNGRFS